MTKRAKAYEPPPAPAPAPPPTADELIVGIRELLAHPVSFMKLRAVATVMDGHPGDPGAQSYITELARIDWFLRMAIGIYNVYTPQKAEEPHA